MAGIFSSIFFPGNTDGSRKHAALTSQPASTPDPSSQTLTIPTILPDPGSSSDSSDSSSSSSSLSSSSSSSSSSPSTSSTLSTTESSTSTQTSTPTSSPASTPPPPPTSTPPPSTPPPPPTTTLTSTSFVPPALTTPPADSTLPSTFSPALNTAAPHPAGFFNNKPVVAGVFTVAGILAAAVLAALIIAFVRRRRQRAFDAEIASAAFFDERRRTGVFVPDRARNLDGNASEERFAAAGAPPARSHTIVSRPSMRSVAQPVYPAPYSRFAPPPPAPAGAYYDAPLPLPPDAHPISPQRRPTLSAPSFAAAGNNFAGVGAGPQRPYGAHRADTDGSTSAGLPRDHEDYTAGRMDLKVVNT